MKNTTQFCEIVFIEYEDDQWWSMSGNFQDVQVHLLHDYQKIEACTFEIKHRVSNANLVEIKDCCAM